MPERALLIRGAFFLVPEVTAPIFTGFPREALGNPVHIRRAKRDFIFSQPLSIRPKKCYNI